MTESAESGAAEWSTHDSGQAARSAALLQGLADELREATRTGVPVANLRDRLPGMDLRDAYAIQTHQLEALRAEGRRVVGRKVGLTSLAMQEQLGVDSPDFGYLLDDMVHGDDASFSPDAFISPKVEPEFAFVLGSPLSGPGVTREDAVAAIGEVRPAIEVIDSRIQDWDIRLVDTVADNASCGAVAVGSTALAVYPADLAGVRCVLRVDGEEREAGDGAAVMGDPIAPLVWLANVLGEQGVGLEAGQIVIPGSFTKALPVRSGERVTADFGDLGSLSVTFQ